MGSSHTANGNLLVVDIDCLKFMKKELTYKSTVFIQTLMKMIRI